MRTAPTFADVAKALVRTAFWFSASNLLVAVLAAQCSNPTQVPNQTISSGTVNYSDNNALAASNVIINGSASVTFVAGNCIHLQPGFHATAGTAGTTFHAWVETAPTADSVTPSSGSGTAQQFTWKASSPSGYNNLSEMYALFNTSVSGQNACYIRYNRGSNLLYLANDAGTAWLGGLVPGSPGTTGNWQCSIDAAGSSVSGAGNHLTMRVSVTFQAYSGGAQNNYLIAYDQYGLNSGWQQMGTWTVPLPNFTLATTQDTYTIVTGVPATPAYTLTVTPINGFSGPVGFSVTPFYGCGNAIFNPGSVAGPPWTTTLTMSCNEPFPNTYITTVQAYGGGITRTLPLYLRVTTTQQYSLTTAANPPGGGSITLNPPGGWYNSGTQVTVTATPNAGYQFSSFTGVDSSNGSVGYVTMNANRSVTANFTLGSLSVTPSSVTLAATQNQIFTVTGTGGAGVTWSLSPASGTLTPNGSNALYTAPVNITTTPVTVTATTANGSASATANLGTGGQPPTISNIQIPPQYLSTTAATVTWTTSANANSQVYWGTSASYTSYSTLDPALTQNHQQYIVGLSPNTTYHYQVRSTDQSGNLATSQDLTLTTPATPPPVPSDFTTCVAGTSAACTLNPGTYAVNATIAVNRYGVTLSGGATDRQLTRLVRGATLTEPLVRVAVPANGTTVTMVQAGASQGVVIQNLTLCGGGNTHPNVRAAPPDNGNPAVMSPPGSPCGDQHMPAPSPCDYTNHVCVDLSVDSIDSGYYPANQYSGPYALELNNVDLEDAPGHALGLYAAETTTLPGGSTSPKRKVNDIWIHGSAINYSAITGILYGFNFVSYDDKFCDHYAEHNPYPFDYDPALVAPRNILIEHNEFRYNNTGAMGGGAVRWVGVRNNNFYVNYISPQGGNFGGGGIEFDPCTDQVEISYNTITGPNSSTGIPPAGYAPFNQTGALELYGRNINVHDNTIRGHGSDGIGGYSLLTGTISRNHVLQDNGWYFSMGGIEVGTSFAPGPCDAVPRDTSVVTVTANDSNPIDVNNNNAPLQTGPATRRMVFTCPTTASPPARAG